MALAARMRRDLELITARVPAPVTATAVAALVEYAAGGASARELAATREAIVATYGDEGTFEERQTFAHTHREMTTWTRDAYDRNVCTLALDNAGRSVVDAAMSALAAPLPARDDDGRVVEADLRTASQRRADAFVEMCGVVATRPAWAVAGDWVSHDRVAIDGSADERSAGDRVADDRFAGAAKSQLMLTMPLADLQQQLGYALDDHGQPLPPSAVRRLCCDADLIPAVLGSRSEVVDLGHTARTASRGQRRALAHRDRGCSFPGCTRPASWCDAHHLIHWADGGKTNVDNLALLCTYHHTRVHQFGYAGRVGPDGKVRWLRALSPPVSPGRTPRIDPKVLSRRRGPDTRNAGRRARHGSDLPDDQWG